MKKWEKMLVLKILSRRFSSISSMVVVMCCSAALLTKMSMRPKLLTTSSTTLLQFSSKPTSAGRAIGSLASGVFSSRIFFKVSLASFSSWPSTYVKAMVAPSRAK